VGLNRLQIAENALDPICFKLGIIQLRYPTSHSPYIQLSDKHGSIDGRNGLRERGVCLTSGWSETAFEHRDRQLCDCNCIFCDLKWYLCGRLQSRHLLPQRRILQYWIASPAGIATERDYRGENCGILIDQGHQLFCHSASASFDIDGGLLNMKVLNFA